MANEYNGKIQGADGLVIVEYLGRNFGNRVYHGSPNGRGKYVFSVNKNRQYMTAADARYMVGHYWQDDLPMFRIVTAEEIAEDVDDGFGEEVGEFETDDLAVKSVAAAATAPTFPSVVGHSVSWMQDEVDKGIYGKEALLAALLEEEANANRVTAVKLLNSAIDEASDEEE